MFHPANEYPDRTSTPLFDATVTDAPTPYAPTSDGTLPPVEPFPAYVTPYVVWEVITRLPAATPE